MKNNVVSFEEYKKRRAEKEIEEFGPFGSQRDRLSDKSAYSAMDAETKKSILESSEDYKPLCLKFYDLCADIDSTNDDD